MTLKKQSFLMSTWLVKDLKNNHLNLYKNLANELKDSFLKKGHAINKYHDFYALIETNIFFFKKKKK